jgi:polyhydroxyalkanoate synthesis regulator phasin
VTCLSGIHEVARELENPFRQVPNELPLVTFQAQFNEALITMFSGYHPDSFWEEEANSFSSSSMHSVDEMPTSETPPKHQYRPHFPHRGEGNGDIQRLIKQMEHEMEEQKAEMARQKHEIERLKGKLKKSEDAAKTDNTVETEDSNLVR